MLFIHNGNNKITELRTIFQRESQNSKLCVPYSLLCFTIEQHMYPTLYFILFWIIMCALSSILFYNGTTCVPYSLFCFIMDHCHTILFLHTTSMFDYYLYYFKE
jgi:hypothetical protein